VGFAEEVGVEIVDIHASLPANITAPRTLLGVTSFVEKIKRYIWKYNFAVDALVG